MSALPERVARALQSVLDGCGWHDAPLERLQVMPAPAVMPTPWPVGPLAAAALGAAGLAAEALWEQRGGQPQQLGLGMRAAGLALATSNYLRVDGRAVKSWDPFTGYYRARGDDWVYLHGNFPHLRSGLLRLFGVADDLDALRQAVALRCADEIEDAAGAGGLCAVKVRSRAEWERHPQHLATASLPLLEITRVGDAPPQPLAAAQRPLSGLRVLDLTRIIAGPMAGRTLAEHGATVMVVSAPQLPSIEPLVIDTGFGKHACHADLDTAAGVAALRGLVSDADVFLNAYRPGALEARGFAPAELARLRPGIVCVSISAFGRSGPWSSRRGYDTLVAAASGLTFPGSGTPSRLPCQPLDYLTGYLAAFGAMLALRRRALEGGSWHVQLSLERTSAWIREMQDVIGAETGLPAEAPAETGIADLYAETDSAFGRLRYLRPALCMSLTPPHWSRPPVPLGSDAAAWPA